MAGEQMPNAQAEQGAPQGRSAMQMAQRINGDLMELAQIFESAGAPEQALNQMAGVIKGFQQAVAGIVQGAQQQQQQREPGGNVPMEAGAAQVEQVPS